MKKFILVSLLNTSILICAHAQGTAEWNGSVSSDWNTADNWTWASGSGIPGPNDDVVIRNGVHEAHVSFQSTANCRNLKLGKYSGDYVTLSLDDSATLNVYGNVLKAYSGTITCTSFEDKTTSLNFLGIGNQTFDISETRVANINIDKPSGDVLLSTEQTIVYIGNSLNFKSQPVSIGIDPPGNLVMNTTALIFYTTNPQLRITTTPYQDNQTPPHIVTNSNYSDLYFYNDFTGDIFVPLSPYVTSFNPITIHSVAESWYIQCWGPPEDVCDSFYNIENAVRRTWIVKPTTEMGTKGTSSHPASVSMTFQVNNVGRDVPVNFNPDHSQLEIWRLEQTAQCWSKIDGVTPMPATGYVTVTTPMMSSFNKLAIAPDTAKPPLSIFDQNGNIASKIKLFPNPAVGKITFDLEEYPNENLHISIFDVLGREMFAKEFKNANRIGKFEVDLSRFEPGFYTVRLSDKGFFDVRKFIKN